MYGQPWKDVIDAIKKLIESRISINIENDIISFVAVDVQAKIIKDREPINLINLEDLRKISPSGGTNFSYAIEVCCKQIAKTNKNINPVLVFLTDGEGDSVQAAEKLL